jgi:hypothetical protein
VNSTEITCRCGKKGWIDEGEISDPCPDCGRVYECYYDKKNYNLKVKLIKRTNYEKT